MLGEKQSRLFRLSAGVLLALGLIVLRRMRVSLAVDDFGVGYSSLALLRRLPLTTLKIDRTFVREITSNNLDVAIVKALLTMADSLGLRVVAEGLENDTQRAALQVLGCREAQGYWFSHPLPTNECGAWLRAHAKQG
jgi:diguanylate cyclase